MKKDGRHFGPNLKTDSIIEHMQKKVDFNMFFQSNDTKTSFLRAYFLHLICDYRFFGEYIKCEILSDLSFAEAVKIGYNEYDLITPKIISKYNLKVPNQIKHIISRKGEGEIKLLNEDTVYKFIDDMSQLNLYDEKNKLTNKYNNL